MNIIALTLVGIAVGIGFIISYLSIFTFSGQPRFWYSNDEGQGYFKCKVIQMGIMNGIDECVFIKN